MCGAGPFCPLCSLCAQLLSLLGVALGFGGVCLSVELGDLRGELVCACLCFWVGAAPLGFTTQIQFAVSVLFWAWKNALR